MEFALSVKDYPFSSILFSARKEHKEIMEYWLSLDVERQVKILEKYNEKE